MSQGECWTAAGTIGRRVAPQRGKRGISQVLNKRGMAKGEAVESEVVSGGMVMTLSLAPRSAQEAFASQGQRSVSSRAPGPQSSSRPAAWVWPLG